jgi:predicted Zn-dependent peptidase
MADRIPAPRVAHLDGGLPLLLTSTADRHSVGLALSLGFGSRDDPPDQGGSAHLLGRLVLSVPLQGGPSLSERIERLGGTSGALTEPESLTIHAQVPTDDAPAVAGWMLDALTEPALSNEALEREASAVASADPDAALESALLDAVLGTAVGGAPTGGARIALDSLLHLHQRALATVPLALAYVGNVQEAELRRRVSPLAMARAGGVRQRRSAHVPAGPPSPRDPVWPDGSCRLLAGAPAPAATDPRRDAYVVLGHLVGAGPESRMSRRLRDEHRLAPAFRAWTRTYSDGGLWCFLAGTDGADGPAVVRALRTELARLAAQGPGPAELGSAVRQARSESLRPAEQGVASAIALASHYCATGAVRCPQAEAERLARVTAADVVVAAAAVLERLLVVVSTREQLC